MKGSSGFLFLDRVSPPTHTTLSGLDPIWANFWQQATRFGANEAVCLDNGECAVWQLIDASS
ncbi:hypothetical protein BRAS3843_620068 [Bradyrhizobium sp. STM 3843]|nr:hypothetical protein BRAS3843_620068 [Bradyrhizobium sp. STM 3843]